MELQFSEEMLRDIIRSELTASKHFCRIPITDEQARQIGAFVSEIASQGNLTTAIRDTQENHAWLRKQRMRGEKLSTAFCYTFFVGVASGICAALWKGIKLLVKDG